MKKLKLYIYPNARPHVQDSMEEKYNNVVPFSKIGIDRHCVLVPPELADFYYMGQVSCGLPLPEREEFQYFLGNEEKHIIDFEGDWYKKSIPNWLRQSIISVSGFKKEYDGIKIFTRLAVSNLLLDMVRNKRQIKPTFESNRSFGFKGLPDPRGIRIKTSKACQASGVKANIIFNKSWGGKSNPNSLVSIDYCKILLQNTFSLCPSGTGVDSVRFFETCFFSRIPVIISDSYTMGHEFNKEYPFYFQIDPNISIEKMAIKIREIESTPVNNLKDMCYNSKRFYETVVCGYLEDPTLTFMEWIRNNEK